MVVLHILVCVDVFDQGAAKALVIGGVFLGPAKDDASSRGFLFDGLQKVVDGLVRIRGDPDALAAGEQLDDRVGGCIGLARAGRALHQHVADVEPADGRDRAGKRIDCIDSITEDRRSRCDAADARSDLCQDRGYRGIAPVALDDAVGVPVDGVTTRKCSECTTSGTLSELRPPVEIAAAAAL